MNDALLLEKIIEISKENGALIKGNDIIRENNKILIEKLNAQSELRDLAEILDELLNVDSKEIEKKIRLLDHERIQNSLSKFRNESQKKVLVKRTLKNDQFKEE